MKLSNEIKVGLLAVASISLLVWGYSYLKGKNLLKRTVSVTVEYDNVAGLAVSDPTFINGLKVGAVGDITLNDDFSGKLTVRIDLDPKVKLPKNTVAYIYPFSVMGEKAIDLRYTGTCNGADCLQDGDKIQGGEEGLMDALTAELDPYIAKAEVAFAEVDSIIQNMKRTDGEALNLQKTLRDFQQTVANLNSASAQLNQLLSASAKHINNTMSNLDDMTSNLKDNNGQVSTILENTATFSAQMKDANVQQTVQNANNAIADMDKTLQTLQTTVETLDKVLVKINSSEGSLGLLVNDRTLYDNLNATSRDLDLLMRDLRLNPKRYTSVLKKKSPEYDPNHPDPATKGEAQAAPSLNGGSTKGD